MTILTPEERARRRIEDRVRHAFSSLRPPDGKLVVAVSGGADSTALLLILERLSRRLSLHLTVAHFDHRLRGDDASRAEREAVEALAKQLGLPFVFGSGDVRSLARKRRRGIEAAAREARYGFLAGVAKEAGSSAVATGHTASDQAETVLMHIIRGSGLRGLAGMSPSAPWPFPGHDDLRVVRPLLSLTRADTESYCALAGESYAVDESNASPEYARNRVRNEVLPLLRELNPRVDEAIVRLAAAVREGDMRDGNLDALRANHAELSDETLSAQNIESFRRLSTLGRTGDRIELPGRVVAERNRDGVVLRTIDDGPLQLPDDCVTLSVPGRGRFGPYVLDAGNECGAEDGIASVMLDAAAVGEVVTVRRRRPGDRIVLAGGTRKLQDVFIDAHIPRAERNAIAVFENERGVLWAGPRVAQWACPTPGEPAVILSYRYANPGIEAP